MISWPVSALYQFVKKEFVLTIPLPAFTTIMKVLNVSIDTTANVIKICGRIA